MCGIFGFSKLSGQSLAPREIQILTRFLALENQSRGNQSTGIAVIDQGNNVFNVRKVKSAEDYLNSSAVVNALDLNITPQTKRLIGHTRFATTGAVILENVQPFQFGDIIGSHNGVIHNHEEIFKKHVLTPLTTCDSEVIYALLSTKKTLKDRASLIGELRGYASVAYHDFKHPENMYFFRVNNILTVCISKEYNFIVWSSDASVLNKLSILLCCPLEKLNVKEDYLTRIDANGTLFERKIPTVYGGGMYGGRGCYSSGGTNERPYKHWTDDDWKKKNKGRYKQMSKKPKGVVDYPKVGLIQSWGTCGGCHDLLWTRFSFEYQKDFCEECLYFIADDAIYAQEFLKFAPKPKEVEDTRTEAEKRFDSEAGA